MNGVIAKILVLACIPCLAFAEPFGLKGDTLGITIEQWEEEHGASFSYCDERDYWILSLSERFPDMRAKSLETSVALELVCAKYYFVQTSDDSPYFLVLIDIHPHRSVSRFEFGSQAKTAIETKYGSPDRIWTPDPDDPDEVARYGVPTYSWLGDDSEILLNDMEQVRLVDFQIVHLSLWRKYREIQNAKLADDL